jgi:hypothetical protein
MSSGARTRNVATPEVSPQPRLQEYVANGDIIIGLVFT